MTQLAAARAVVAEMLTWWMGELTALIPGAVRKRLSALRARPAVNVWADGWAWGVISAGEFSPAMVPPRTASDSLTILMPVDWLFRKVISLPKEARISLGSILEFEVERHVPLSRDTILFGYRVLASDPASTALLVELGVVKRGKISGILSDIAKQDVRPARISVTDDPKDAGFRLPTAKIRSLRWESILFCGLFLLALALGGSLLMVRHQAAQQEIDRLAAALSQAKIEVRKAEAVQQAINAIMVRRNLVVEERCREHVIASLEGIAQILPDGTWVTHYEYRDGKLRLSGQSDAAAGLIDRIEASPTFAKVRFQAPLLQGRRPGLQQFDIAMEFEREGTGQ